MKPLSHTFLRFSVIAILFAVLVFDAQADNDRDEQLGKQYSELIKQVKKTNNLKKLKIREEKDGRVLLYGESKEGMSLYDIQGNCIVKPKCSYLGTPITAIYYQAAVEAGTSDIPVGVKDSEGRLADSGEIFSLAHPARPASILALASNSMMHLYDSTGKELRYFQGSTYAKGNNIMIIPIDGIYIIGFYPPLYTTSAFGNTEKLVDKFLRGEDVKFDKNTRINFFAKDKSNLTLTSRSGMGMIVSSDGRIIADKIHRLSVNTAGNCIITRKVDGVERRGLADFYPGGMNIPVKFNDVRMINNRWKVQRNRHDDYEPFDPMADYTISYQDEGEKHYNKNNYLSADRFYTNNIDSAPAARFFLAMSKLNQSVNQRTGRERFISLVNGGKYHDSKKMSGYKYRIGDLLKDAYNYCEQYLAEAPELDPRRAPHEAQMKIAQGMIGKLILQEENDFQRYQQAVVAYNELDAKYQKNMENIRKLEEFKQQLAEAQSIVNSAQSSGGRSSSSSSAAKSGGKAGGNGSSAPAKADNTDRKIFLKNQIIEWKNKLKKAEQSRDRALKAMENDNGRKAKQVLDSKTNTVNECLNMIRQYESELNSLR